MNYSIFSRFFIRKSIFLGLLVSVFGFVTSSSIYAAPGDLDRSFGNNGIIKTMFGSSSGMTGSALQPDGKFVIVGTIFQSGSNDDFYVLRFNSDGSIDTGFGVNGRAIIPVSPRQDGGTNVTLQPDGKIIIVGYSRDSSANYDFAIVRLNENGIPDTTFGNNGVVIQSTSSTNDYANDAVIQSDNKIVVCGSGPNSSGTTFTVARFNSNGSLDTTFNVTGINQTQFPNGLSSAKTVKIQSDGKIIAAGASAFGDFIHTAFGFARYNTNGTLDSAFGNNGIAVVDVRTSVAQQNSANEIIFQPDGKIIAVGSSNSGLDHFFDFAVTRLNTNGSVDTSFGNEGKVVTTISNENGYDIANDVILQSDGKLLVGGRGQFGNSTNFAVVKYNSNGTLDTRFGNKGIAVARLLDSGEFLNNLRIEPDGKIFAAGLSGFEITFAKFQVNGLRESDFDGDKKSDVSVFRSSNGAWYLNQSTNGFTGVSFGLGSDILAPSDFDGDGKIDISVFRDGVWYYLKSSNGAFVGLQFGQTGDIPIPADFDGDGKADINVFRPSNGAWYRLNSSDGSFSGVIFGQNGDKPLLADFDGDGKNDIAVFRPSAGAFYWLESSTGTFKATAFGFGTDIPTMSDFDGDGKTDIAVFRPSNGTWYRFNSSNSAFVAVTFGQNGDIPVAADFDGDGKSDIAVFRNGNWYYLNSSNGAFVGLGFGLGTDKPIPSVFN